ncbi:hypothetical protein [Dyadobacter sp. 3J3]|uniref:hypothetical protein n=1 Tax=Dyadobacter sp. 3J3 TaxID=2606600 RepID=UPI001357691E|nr:hypothetical protein [Dyadobacter sp. 3J3]
MKKFILSLSILFFFQYSYAQDDVKVTLTEETDTLVKQRFIDRYENVFMTKVQTRHMFKIGLSQYYQSRWFSLKEGNVLTNTSLQLGYEFKFLPAFSIAISGHMPFYGFDIPIKDAWQNTVIDTQLRWYVNMRKRIKSGKSANNFSGNYLALNYTLPGTLYEDPTIGLKLGFQRRFLNSGFMDFAIALQQGTPWFHYGVLYNWSISSQASFGLAFGDWKKSSKFPLCDLLLCNELIGQQWKIRLPELTIGRYLYRLNLSFAYERKFNESPFSINYQTDIGLNKGYNYMLTQIPKPTNFFSKYQDTHSTEASITFSIQPRYYFLQERQKVRSGGGNGMSGVYAGINTEYNFYTGRNNPLRGPDTKIITQNNIRTGPLLGFQQRLFSHGYIDFNTSYNFQKDLNIPSSHSFGFRGNLGIGFAF